MLIMKNILKILAIIIIYFIPAILFFLMVVLLYIQAVLSSFFEISFIYQVLLVSLILFITFGAPFYLISFWRKLYICFSSFLAYFLNNFILLLQLFGIYYTYFILDHQIFLKDLTNFSQYRYLLLLTCSFLITVIVFSFFILGIKKPFWYDYLFFPYLKDNMFNYLYSWNQFFMGDICIFIIDKLFESLKFRSFYFTIRFILFIFSNLVKLTFFINFCFFNGDLRLLLYFSIVSCIISLFSFLDYYLITFIKANVTTINDFLNVSIKNTIKSRDSLGFIIIKNIDDLVFVITPQGFDQGFTYDNFDKLKESWIRLINVTGFFEKYNYYVKFLRFFIFFSYFSCWFFIVKSFFYDSTSPFNEGSLFSTYFNKVLFKTSVAFIKRDARYINEKTMGPLKEKTNGAYSPGHPVYGTPDGKGGYTVEGSLTRGRGTSQNPSEYLDPEPIDPNKPQRVIPFPKNIHLPEKYLKKPIPNSEQYLEKQSVKEVLDKPTNEE